MPGRDASLRWLVWGVLVWEPDRPAGNLGALTPGLGRELCFPPVKSGYLFLTLRGLLFLP